MGNKGNDYLSKFVYIEFQLKRSNDWLPKSPFKLDLVIIMNMPIELLVSLYFCWYLFDIEFYFPFGDCNILKDGF